MDSGHSVDSVDSVDGIAGEITVVRTRAELRLALGGAPRPVGLVPTMGWLHAGHRALVERARADNATTVVSIFVNPRQFGDPSDLQQYPRNESRDVAICAEEGADLVFAPSVDEVYPPGFDTVVQVGAVARPLEGAARPGHFDGVATVVAVLFNLVGAERAYFGQKDAQQLRVIRQMARDLALPIEVIGLPTVREPDGLAMSSRNRYLDVIQRQQAAAISEALFMAERRLRTGEQDLRAVAAEMRQTIESAGLSTDYATIRDPRTLNELTEPESRMVLLIAARLGGVRLIDNLEVTLV